MNLILLICNLIVLDMILNFISSLCQFSRGYIKSANMIRIKATIHFNTFLKKSWTLTYLWRSSNYLLLKHICSLSFEKVLQLVIDIMPPRQLSVDEAIKIVRLFIDHFRTDKLPDFKDDVWEQMSIASNGKWTARSFWTNIKYPEKRGNILQRARELEGIIPEVVLKNDHSFLNESYWSSSDLDDSRRNNIIEIPSERLKIFEISISPGLCQVIREKIENYGKGNHVLPKSNALSELLSHEFFLRTQLPCVFDFKQLNIYKTSTQLLEIIGKCKSQPCSNPFFGYIYKDSDKSKCVIHVHTRDSFLTTHEKLIRQSNNDHEETSVQDIDKNCSLTELCDTSSNNNDNVVTLIEKMQNEYLAGAFIHDMKRQEFYVFYSTPLQKDHYKQYCTASKQNITIYIGRADDLVKPIVHYDGTPTDNIFFYSIFIYFEGFLYPIHHMFSESAYDEQEYQSVNKIEWWIKEWIASGISKPSVVRCYPFMTCIKGLTLGFNNQSIEVYMETLLLCALKSPKYYLCPGISTYVQFDVIQLMKMIRSWPCFDTMRLRTVRQFFLNAVALMVYSQNLEQFQNIYFLTNLVGLNEFKDSIVRGSSVENSRLKLVSYMKQKNLDFALEDTVCKKSCINHSYSFNELEKLYNNNQNSRIKTWIIEFREKAENVEIQGRDDNAYFFEDFINNLMKLAVVFPLWTSIYTAYDMEVINTNPVENFFIMKKSRNLKHGTEQVPVNLFLQLEFKEYFGNQIGISNRESSLKRAESSLKQKISIAVHNCQDLLIKQNDKEFHTKLPIDDPDTISVDNWRNKGRIENVESDVEFINDKISCYNYDIINKNDNFVKNESEMSLDGLNIKKSIGILENGNYQNNIIVDGNQYYIQNTCAFDSLIQVLAATGFDDTQYRSFINSSGNQTLLFVSNFIRNGTTLAIYQERAKLIKSLFKTELTPKNIYSVNAWTSVPYIWESCLKSEPSAFITVNCDSCGQYIVNVQTLDISWKIIRKKGYSALLEALFYINNKRNCRNCYKQSSIEIFYNHHLFLELGIQVKHTNNVQNVNNKKVICQLSDFPVYLNLSENHIYRIAGVIAAIPGHFKAYIRKQDGSWELYNDSPVQCLSCSPFEWIQPEGAIYVKVYSSTENWLNTPFEPEMIEKNENWILHTEKFNPISVNDKIIFIKDISNFDALFHIFMLSVKTSPKYLSSIKKSSNCMLQFVLKSFIEGASYNLYQLRANLLTSLYSEKVQLAIDDHYIFNINENINETWETLLSNEPSGFQLYTCSQCQSYIKYLFTLTIDQTIITRNGYSALQQALKWHNTLLNVSCRQNSCLGFCTVTCTTNFHIYIELNNQSDKYYKKLTNKLSDFPNTLQLEYKYRLAGIINRSKDRYIAYCPVERNHWEIYDSSTMNISICDSSKNVDVCGAIYVIF